jgi:glutamate-1-semialdehyde 2,1-aminomutase
MVINKSESLFNRARNLIPAGVNSPVRFYEPYPFFAASAKGSKIVTADHDVYTDYCMAYGSILLGHANATVIESVKSQLEDGTLFCVPTEKEVKLAELISGIISYAEMTRLVNTGSEATMNAIRLARAYTRKNKIIKFEGCYHGAHDYVLVKGGLDLTNSATSYGSIEEVSSQTIVVPYNEIIALEQVLEENDENIACVIVEPVCANMGLILPEKEYLNELREITHDKNILLIFDEVVTGFRLALGGAAEFFGIEPDLATFAKAMGSGFPIAAIAGKNEIMQHLAPSGKVYQASTYAGNPVSVSASIANIELLIQEKNIIYPKIARTCNNIVNGIKEVLNELEMNYTINSIGSMYQLFFTPEKVKDAKSAKKSNLRMFRKLYDELLRKGVFIPPSQFESCFISYAHGEDDIDMTIESYRHALYKVKEALS